MHWRLRSGRRRAFNEPGHAHGLTCTCFHRYPFLSKESPCQWLAEAIDEARVALDFALWAYVFMPDHCHLIVYPRRVTYSVSTILTAIKSPVARRAVAHLQEHAPAWHARLAVRHGERMRYHFWQQGGGFDRNITEAKALFDMIEYIHLNPVRKGLVTDARAWKWSSARAAGDGERVPLAVDPVPVEWAVAE